MGMHTITTEFFSRAALFEALNQGPTETGMFVPGDFDLPAGTPVLVRVVAKGMVAEIFLEGVVQWRRVASRATSARTLPGLGVRMLASHQSRLNFLKTWASGLGADSGRNDVRYPTQHGVVITSYGRGTGRMFHCTLRDVSAHGAMITTPTRLTAGTEYMMDLQRTSNSVFRCRVVWATDDRAGLRLHLDRKEEAVAWNAFVNEARNRCETAQVSPKSNRPSPIAPTAHANYTHAHAPVDPRSEQVNFPRGAVVEIVEHTRQVDSPNRKNTPPQGSATVSTRPAPVRETVAFERTASGLRQSVRPPEEIPPLTSKKELP